MVMIRFLTQALVALGFAVSLASALPAASPKVNYDGTRVVRVFASDEAKLEYLEGVISNLGLSTWTTVHKTNSNIDIQIPKEQVAAFNQAVDAAKGFTVTTMHEDLGASIEAESEGMFSTQAAAVDQSWFTSYHAYADHLTWLSSVVAAYPSNSAIVTSGTSVGGRAITGIHIYGSSGAGVKPAVVLHSTVHAREWISTMVNEYIAYSLLSNYANTTDVKGYVDKYDFYIFPVVNPDGFVYTQTTERLWRKNRQTNSGSTCVGRDINRNWPWKWDVTGGASTNPCAQDYKGVAAGDTPENQGLSALLTKLSGSTAGAKMFIDWHSYSQLFMWPYGYSCSAVAADNTEFTTLGRGFVAAVKAVNSQTFTPGPICTTIYQATGTSVDYSYDVAKIKYSFTTELRDTGSYGFVLPVSQILPSSTEIWAGFKYLLANIQ